MPKIALLSTQLDGGIGRALQNLSRGFVDAGFQVDFLLDRDWGHYVDSVRKYCVIRRLRTTHAWRGIPELLQYLRMERPCALITDTPRLTHLAVRSARLMRRKPRVAAVIHSTYSLKFGNLPDAKRTRRLRRMHELYPRADNIIAVSNGVAQDFARYTDIHREIVKVIYNPIIPPGGICLEVESNPISRYRQANEHLLVAMGRLTPEKDFATLIRAVRHLRDWQPARLVIFGDGPEHDSLIALAQDIGIDDSVVLAGQTDHPYAAMACADALVLSSRWEGFGNVLAEAMAVGTPVVATDCPNGPREILEDGRWGRLVPVGDAAALADAILGTLRDPCDATALQASAQRFDTARISAEYLQALGLYGTAGNGTWQVR